MAGGFDGMAVTTAQTVASHTKLKQSCDGSYEKKASTQSVDNLYKYL